MLGRKGKDCAAHGQSSDCCAPGTFSPVATPHHGIGEQQERVTAQIQGPRESREAGVGGARTLLIIKLKTLQSGTMKSGQRGDDIKLISLTKAASQLGILVDQSPELCPYRPK